MVRSLRQSFALLFAGLVAACGDATGPGSVKDVDLDFGIQRIETEPAFVVSDVNGEVKIRGTFEAPCASFRGDAEAVESGGVLTVRLTATNTGIPCLDVLASIGYEANVRDVASGTYRLRVVHVVSSHPQEGQIVLDTPLVVE
jgi:hypothetical protein